MRPPGWRTGGSTGGSPAGFIGRSPVAHLYPGAGHVAGSGVAYGELVATNGEQRDFPAVFPNQFERVALPLQIAWNGNAQRHPPAVSRQIGIQVEGGARRRKQDPQRMGGFSQRRAIAQPVVAGGEPFAVFTTEKNRARRGGVRRVIVWAFQRREIRGDELFLRAPAIRNGSGSCSRRPVTGWIQHSTRLAGGAYQEVP